MSPARIAAMRRNLAHHMILRSRAVSPEAIQLLDAEIRKIRAAVRKTRVPA